MREKYIDRERKRQEDIKKANNVNKYTAKY